MKFSKWLLLALIVVAQADAIPYIRFWQGFKTSQETDDNFVFNVGWNFLPATIAMGRGKGLIAYLPALLPIAKKRWAVETPDEIALVVYENKEIYTALRATPIGTAYAEMHWDHFVKELSSSFTPEEWPKEDAIEFKHAYVVTGPADDWQKFPVTYAVETRKPDISEEAYKGAIRTQLSKLRENPAKAGIRSLLVSFNEGYTLYYYQWENQDAANKHVEKPTEKWAAHAKSVVLPRFGGVKWQWGEGVNIRF